MNNLFVKRTVRRVIELLGSTIIISVIIAWMNKTGTLATQRQVAVATLIGVAIFSIINIRFSRNSYFRLKNLKLYYGANYIALVVYAFVLAIFYKLFGNVAYTWLFAITKCISYLPFGVGRIQGVGGYLLGLAVIIAASPLGMKFVVMYHKDEK